MRKNIRIWGLLFGCALIVFIAGGWIETFFVEVNESYIHDAIFHTVLKDKIVVHISDLHIKKIGIREKRVLKLLEELKPDLIFLTGDYVEWRGDYEPALIFLSRLKAETGIWAVMGDYDYSDSRKSCLFCHGPGSGETTERHAARFLKSSIATLHQPEGDVYIAGIDDTEEGVSAFNSRLEEYGKNTLTILLSHNPLTFDRLKKDQHVLLLSGDTHGGQIPLPGWLWKILGYKKNARYNQGFFQDGEKKMVVSRGVGTSHLPVRLFCRPEITVLHFIK